MTLPGWKEHMFNLGRALTTEQRSDSAHLAWSANEFIAVTYRGIGGLKMTASVGRSTPPWVMNGSW